MSLPRARRGRKPHLAAPYDDARELCPREPFDRWVVTRADRPKVNGRTVTPSYGYVLLRPNFRIVAAPPSELPVVLDARNEYESSLEGEMVEVHRDLQEARNACRRYNDVQGVLES